LSIVFDLSAVDMGRELAALHDVEEVALVALDDDLFLRLYVADGHGINHSGDVFV
jgi:hypothetical protein